MDFPTLPEGSLAAGRDYFEQLKHLGLHPEGLFWVHDVVEDRFVLWLVWSGVDRFGPLAITELLFKAYRASALTREIDPFCVEVRSPAELLVRDMINMSRDKDKHEFRVVRKSEQGKEPFYQWSSLWVYHLQSKKRGAVDMRRDWRRFSERVNALAA